MIEEALSLYADFSKKLYPVIIVLSLVLAVASLNEASKTEISTDVLGFFYQDTPGMKEARIIDSDFTGVDSATILIEADRILIRDVLGDDVLEMTAEIVDVVSTVPGVFQVTSVLDLGSSREEILKSPGEELKEFISRDMEYSIVDIKLDSAEIPDRVRLVTELQKTVGRVEKAKGTEVTVAGAITGYYAWEQAVRSGFSRSIIASAVTIAIVLFFVFRSPITAGFIMIPVLVAVLAAFGAMHFINVPLNFLTVMFGAVSLGLGVDYSIHLVQRYHEELDIGNELALNTAVAKIGRNTVFTSLTTMAAFSSMALAGLRMVAEYGLMSFIAISFSALSVILFLPSYLILESKIGRRRIDLNRITNALGLRGVLPSFMTKLSDFSIKKPVAILVFTTLALFPVFYGMSQIESMTDEDSWLPQDMPAVKANNLMQDEFGGYDYAGILFLADDVRSPDVMEVMIELHEEVAKVPKVVEVTSLAGMLNPMPSDKETLEQQIGAISLDLRKQFVTKDYTESIMYIKVDGEVDEETVRQIEEVLESVDIPGDAVITQAGISYLMSRIDSIMAQDQMVTTIASLILVTIMLYLALRGFSNIILGLAPVLLAILFAMGIMGLLEIPSTPLTVMLATLVLGLGIDYSIHFIARYKEERAKGLTLEEAIRATSVTVGESIAITSITTTFGFLSLMTMTLVPVQDFGKIAAVGLVLCMILVPMIISVGLLFQERVVGRAMESLTWRS